MSLSVHAIPLVNSAVSSRMSDWMFGNTTGVQHKGGGMKQNGMGQDKGCSEKGIALLEVMTVVVIVAILAAIAAPAFVEWQKSLACRKVTRNIASTLRYARSRTINTNLEHRVEYETEKGRYRLMQGDRSVNSGHWDTIVNDWTILPPGVHLESNVNSGPSKYQWDLEWRHDIVSRMCRKKRGLR